MPRPNKITITPDGGNATEFATNVTGDTFILTNNNTSDGLAHLVSIANNSGTDYSGITITLTGKDQDGISRTDIVTGPGSAATVTSSLYFEQLDSAIPSSSIGEATFNIGMDGAVVTKTFPLNYRSPLVFFDVNLDGIGAWTAQQTASRINDVNLTPLWRDHPNPNYVTQNTSASGSYAPVPLATRLSLKSYAEPITAIYSISHAD